MLHRWVNQSWWENKLVLILSSFLERSFIWLKISIFHQKLLHRKNMFGFLYGFCFCFFFLLETEYPTESGLNDGSPNFLYFGIAWETWLPPGEIWFRWSGMWPRSWEGFSGATEVENHSLHDADANCSAQPEVCWRWGGHMVGTARDSVMSSRTQALQLSPYSQHVSVSTLRHRWLFSSKHEVLNTTGKVG